jgi:hypothetical protein
MTLDELEAAVGWLERNRISDHLHRIARDPQYRWSSRQRRRAGSSDHPSLALPASGLGRSTTSCSVR